MNKIPAQATMGWAVPARRPSHFRASGYVTCFRRSPQWSYPSAIIHEDALYAAYTVSKEDAALSVVPLDCLC